MKYKTFLILIVMVLTCLYSYAQEDGKTFINHVSSIDGTMPESYVPPLVSNGSLSMLVDYTGGQLQQEYVKMIPVIYWAGRRYGPPKDALISFGHFEQEYTVNGQVYSQPDTWEQTLDTKRAIVSCMNTYGEALRVETVVFTHLQHDLIVVKKRFYTKSAGVNSVKVSFKYQFTPPGKENRSPKRVFSECSWNDKTQSVEYRYESDAYQPTKGIISVFSDQTVSPSIDGQATSLVSEMKMNGKNPSEITYYLLFSDTMDGDDYMERQSEMQIYVRDSGYEKILGTHESGWAQFCDESYVSLPDKKMEKVYNTAQYHLMSNATKWSFPVGIFTTHWAGRYFGWDEMFCFQALASSNHLDISRRCPEFRCSVLPKATYRIAHYGKSGQYGARYPWEVYEDGAEGTPPGFWLDHVFHMSNIALSAWLQYLYSADTTYLRKTGYPVVKECARFYVSHMVYEDSDGRMFIGKCTDLERLGPAKQNPFMTACGTIYTLEAAVKASGILGEDKNEAEQWGHIAVKLRESLPSEHGRYVPYQGCEERSVASLGGLFPYPIFDSGNQLQRNAVYDFVNEGKASGNMYPVGKSLCAWYAGWLAAALDLLGDRTEPGKLLTEAANGAGCFSELFEINETEVKMHPWFSTASGNYVYALNQMLVQSKEDQILVAPAVPDSWRDYSFKLACYEDLTATVVVKEGKITKLLITHGHTGVKIRRTLKIPSYLITMKQLNEKAVSSFETNGGYCYIHFDIKDQIQIF
ncbi:MAG: hypothetical protein A2W90_00045 [Bacteroidetes bacterium GWF2_42_66]|nr:MAG: hypothetical protein A2W92_09225 [Bacteroidetes bacterium GWA2_42_15]OFY44122.1 MAG: hypothetical protein A2W90_00045 [Bacteroidetes bacterium GWF2_42_66]